SACFFQSACCCSRALSLATARAFVLLLADCGSFVNGCRFGCGLRGVTVVRGVGLTLLLLEACGRWVGERLLLLAGGVYVLGGGVYVLGGGGGGVYGL